jgi:pectin methylesterase-like acyl-CoA thioesterase
MLAAATLACIVPAVASAVPRYAQELVVAKAGGDYTSLTAALASITDASATKPYAVVVKPGVYAVGTTRIVVPPFVTIQGSGTGSTQIASSYVSTNGTGFAQLGNNIELRSLTFTATGANAGLVISAATARLEDVQVSTLQSSQALSVLNGSKVSASRVRLTSGNGSGLYVQNSELTGDAVVVRASGYSVAGVVVTMASRVALENSDVALTVTGGGQGTALTGYTDGTVPIAFTFKNGVVTGDAATIGVGGYVTVSHSVLNTPYAATSSQAYLNSPVLLYSQVSGGFYIPTRVLGCYDSDFNPLPNQ